MVNIVTNIKRGISEGTVNTMIDLAYQGVHKLDFTFSISLEELLADKYSYAEQLKKFVDTLSEKELRLYEALVDLEEDHDSYVYYDVDKKILHQLAYTFKDKYVKFLKDELGINEEQSR